MSLTKCDKVVVLIMACYIYKYSPFRLCEFLIFFFVIKNKSSSGKSCEYPDVAPRQLPGT